MDNCPIEGCEDDVSRARGARKIWLANESVGFVGLLQGSLADSFLFCWGLLRRINATASQDTHESRTSTLRPEGFIRSLKFHRTYGCSESDSPAKVMQKLAENGKEGKPIPAAS